MGPETPVVFTNDGISWEKEQAWKAILYALKKGIANFRLAGWAKLSPAGKEAFTNTALKLYKDKEDTDKVKITEFFRQLFVELEEEWQYKILLVLYANIRGGRFYSANGALQVVNVIWSLLAEKNREEVLHLLASAAEIQKDMFIKREIVGTLQIMHSKLSPPQKEWILHRYFEWMPGKTVELTLGIVDAIRDLLEDLTPEELIAIPEGHFAKVVTLLDAKQCAVNLAGMRIAELLIHQVDENIQGKFLNAGLHILREKNAQYYRELFTSLKNIWSRFSHEKMASAVVNFHPFIAKIYQKRDTLEASVQEIFQDFFEDYWESLPDNLKREYYKQTSNH